LLFLGRTGCQMLARCLNCDYNASAGDNVILLHVIFVHYAV
jgi:hypothetical protein